MDEIQGVHFNIMKVANTSLIPLLVVKRRNRVHEYFSIVIVGYGCRHVDA